jgi:thioredoxin-dependent peroxiredoxin
MPKAMNKYDFNLPDQDGREHTFTEFRGKWLLVYFYPKDDTPGCTKEACSFRDGFKLFTERNIAIVGISKDSVKSHKKFAEKYHLDFPLLADESKDVIKSYGAWTEHGFMGHPGIGRNSYLFNPEGTLVKEYIKVKPELHAAEILRDVTAVL